MQRSIQQLICLMFLLALAHTVGAQQELSYTFTHYSTKNGLLSNQVNTVVQDEQGFIWLGTTDGLQRFDGVRYKTFRHKPGDSTTIPTNPIWQLMMDDNHNLWVLLAEGQAGIFDTKTFKFRQATITTQYPAAIQSSIKELRKDESGNVFLLLGGYEVLLFNAQRHSFEPANSFIPIKKDWRIADFAHQPGTNKYWLCLLGGSIAVYNNDTKQLSYKGHNVEQEQVIEDFKAEYHPYGLFFDSKGRLWFFIWGGGIPYIYCYDLRNRRMLLEKIHLANYTGGYYEVHGFLEQADGTIWLRGLQVFARFNEQTRYFDFVQNATGNERSIVYEHVRALVEDKENNVWVATTNNGLYRFNPAQHVFLNVAHNNRLIGKKGKGSVMSFARTSWGTLFVGVWGDGLYHYDKDLKPIPIGLKGFSEMGQASVWSMYASPDSNTLWLSAQPGLYRVDQKKREATFYNPPVMDNRTVRQVVEDRFGNLWLGTQSKGLFKWEKSKGSRHFNDGVSSFEGLPQFQVNKLLVDSRGLVWVALSSTGAYAIDPANGKIVYHFSLQGKEPFRLPQDGVSSMLEYNDSLMLITTGTQIMLFNRNSNQSRLIGTTETISGYIAAVEKDSKGYVWLTSTNGLYRINLNKELFIRFNKLDGIDNDNFILSASCALPNGNLLFGSSDQFLIFDPLAIIVNNTLPKVVITDFKVRNKSLPVDSLLKEKLVRLKPGNNSVVFEFSTLRYNTSYKISYMMEGLDKDWRMADDNWQAVYSYIPSGTYTFRVRLMDEEGRMSEEETTFRFRMTAPFWQTWWFYTLLALVLVWLIYWFDRERMKRKEAMLQMRAGIASNLHNEINTALHHINILSEMAKMKTEQDPQKSKEYIEQIHARSHNMIIAMDDMLWSIDPENDNMHKTVNRMKEYIDALRNRHQVEIEMVVDKKVEALELNMQLRHEAFLLFKEGIKALVDAGAQSCHVHMGLEKSKLIFTMQFSNESCDFQQLNNLLQRQDMEQRLATIKAQLNVQVHKSTSIFVLQVPVD